MTPLHEHINQVFSDLAFGKEHLEDLVPEDLLQMLQFEQRRYSENAVSTKTAVGAEHMQMRMPFDPYEAIMEDATVKITINDLSDIGPKKAILLGKALIPAAAGVKRLEMVFNKLVILRILWFTRKIYGRGIGHGWLSLANESRNPRR
jgi:hypothetical protein